MAAKPTMQLNTRVSPEVFVALDEYVTKKGVTKSAAVERALRKLLKLPA